MTGSRLCVQEKLFLLLCMMASISWIDPFAFFKGDDWIFIIDFANNSLLSNWLSAHGGHVIPFYKVIYYLELSAFGKNAVLFQVLSTALWGLNSFAVFLILRTLSGNKNPLHFLIPAVLCLHPNFADVLYWIFQQGVIFHILFQSLSILFYLKFLKNSLTANLVCFISFLLLQNYFFGNGVLFPLLFIVHYMIIKQIIADRFILSTLAIQLLFITVQKLLSHQQISISDVIGNSGAILKAWTNLMTVSISRLLFIKPTEENWITYTSLLILGIIIYKAFRTHPKHSLFALLFLIISSVSIPIARTNLADYQNHEIHYYYSVLLFPALFLMLYIALSELKFKNTSLSHWLAAMVFVGLIFINLQAKRIYSYRNFKNKEFLMTAIIYGKPNYYPYDDAIFSSQKNIYLDNIDNAEVQKSMQKTNYFGADSAILYYMGRDNFQAFIGMNRRVLNSFAFLSSQSAVDLDIKFEKH